MPASRPSTPEVNAAVLSRIERYSPLSVDQQVWSVIAPLVRQVVTAVQPPTPGAATTLMGTASQYVVWCTEQGLPLGAEDLFTPARVDDYLARTRNRCKDTATRLRRIGRAATVRAPWSPPAPRRGRTPRQSPYSPDELDALWDWAANQPTKRLRHLATLCLVMPLAFGCTSAELASANKDDLTDDGEVILWAIPGVRARTVPALAAYVDEVRAALQAIEPHADLVIGDRIDNVLQDLKKRGRAAHRLQVMRLRSTWAVAVLSTPVTIPEFMALSGLRTTAILAALAPHLPCRSPAEVVRTLGGRS